MKKIYTLLLMMFVTLVLASCGPNQNYYRIKATPNNAVHNIFVNNENGIIIDLYTILFNNRALVKELDPEIRLLQLKNKFNIEVEYREAGFNSFKPLQLNDKFQIAEDTPVSVKGTEGTILFANKTYDFKIHFIDKETNSRDTMINLYLSYKFIPAILKHNGTVSIVSGSELNLLENLIVYNKENKVMTLDEIKETYDIKYSFAYGDVPQTIAVTDNKATFDSAKKYTVTITLTDKSAADSQSSATEPASGSSSSLSTSYDIDVQLS